MPANRYTWFVNADIRRPFDIHVIARKINRYEIRQTTHEYIAGIVAWHHRFPFIIDELSTC